MKPSLINAVLDLVPDAKVSCAGDVIIWHESPATPVDDVEIFARYQELLEAYENKEYQRLRAAEYPPVTDYLDGVVKGDQAQIDKYVADCLAVKAKYPKPTN